MVEYKIKSIYRKELQKNKKKSNQNIVGIGSVAALVETISFLSKLIPVEDDGWLL